MRVLIRGAGFINKGAEALAMTVRDQLLARQPDCQCVFHGAWMAAAEAQSAEVAGFRLVNARSSSKLRKSMALMRLMAHGPENWRELASNPGHVYIAIDLVGQVDAVLDVSGYSYGDAWGPGQARMALPYVLACRMQGKPYVFMPQAYGPFEAIGDRPAYKTMFAASRLVYSRDEVSRGYLASLMGAKSDAYQLCPDIAFLFRPETGEEASDLLNRLGLGDGGYGPVAGIAPNRRVYERASGTGENNQYIRALVSSCAVFRGHGARVVLVPHEVDVMETSQTDDRALCGLVQAMSGDPEVLAVTSRQTAGALKAVISRMDVLLGSRYHALIAALSSHVPAAALGWSHKYDELFGMFGLEAWATAGAEVEEGETRLLAERLWEQRDHLRSELASKVPFVQQTVHAVFDHIVAVIKQGPSRR